MSNGNCTGYQVKMSGFRTRLGHCVVFLGEALFSHSASLQSGVKMDTGELCVCVWGGGGGALERGGPPPRGGGAGGGGGGGGYLEMDWHPIQGGSSTAHAIETWIRSGMMDCLTQVQTSPLPTI